MQNVKVKTKGEDGTVSRLAPPGVTGNCVVEVRWRESAMDAPGPLPESYGYFHQWELGNRYKTLLTAVDLPMHFEWGFLFSGPEAQMPKVEKNTYTAHNIPAAEEVAFGLAPLRERPRLTVFWQPETLTGSAREGRVSYWNAVGKQVYKDWVTKVTKGPAFAALARELATDLPGDSAQMRALHLMSRLDAKIVNTDALTWEEKSHQTKDEDKRPKAADLEAAARTHRTSGYGMFLMYVQLLKNVGITPKVAFVTPRSRRIFNENLLSPFQLDEQIVGIPGGPNQDTIWVDPSERFASPGLIWPEYQGTRGLEVDLDTWEVKSTMLPVQASAYNVRVFQYVITPDEEDDRFQLTARFSGYPEYVERRRFMALEPKEQSRTLKEDLEEDLVGATISKAEVHEAHSAGLNVRWEVEGRVEREAGRRRTVRPFPGLPAPLPAPDSLPESRSMLIVLPYARTHAASSQIHVPEGYRLAPVEPFNKANVVGTVSWSAAQASPELAKVALKVEIQSALHPPEHYAALKEFLAWVREARGRVLTLERAGGSAQ
jgi:hypothetical protein